MDEIDLKLLRLLQKNARTPIKALAGEVRLSSPAVSARIERLEKQGIIRAYTLDLDPLQLGHHILAYIHLDMQPTQKEEFYPFIAACSNVLECNCVTGNYSMLIKVSFASTQELDALSDVCKNSARPKHRSCFPRRCRESHCGMRKSLRVQAFFFYPQDGGSFDLSAC